MAKIQYFHANAKGTGSCAIFALHPASAHDAGNGYINLTLAKQKTIASQGAVATFDFENVISVDFEFLDIVKMLQVFRGYTESLCNESGLYKVTSGKMILARLEHIIEPDCGYRLTIDERTENQREPRTASIVFNTAESLGLALAYELSLKDIAFGKGE